jgi:hypothetical protein
MRTATLTISIDIEEEEGLDERPDDFYCAELLLEVVASQSDQALMGYITVAETDDKPVIHDCPNCGGHS